MSVTSTGIATTQARAISPTLVAPPDRNIAQALAQAVKEISVCWSTFVLWKSTLDMSNSKHADVIEEKVRWYITSLIESSEDALRDTENIVITHKNFARKMCNWLAVADARSFGSLVSQPELIALASNIHDCCEKLAIGVKRMLEQVQRLVQALESGKSARTKFFGWLRRVLEALSFTSSVVATPFVIVHHADDSTRGREAKHTLLIPDGDKKRSFGHILSFLQDMILRETARVRLSLDSYKEAHNVVQVQMDIQRGGILYISRADAKDTWDSWEKQEAELHEIVLPHRKMSDPV